MDDREDTLVSIQKRDDTGAQVGGAAGQAAGQVYGGPLGGMVGQKVGESVGSFAGDKIEEMQSDDSGDDKEGEEEKKRGGNCSGNSEGDGEYKASDGQCHKTPETPRYKLEIEDNDIPENWWDKLPDFDPRVYDAIALEQAAACVKYVFDGLPDVHELENMMESRKNRKTCSRLKTNVPRTQIVKPKELKYTTTIDSWMKKDSTY